MSFSMLCNVCTEWQIEKIDSMVTINNTSNVLKREIHKVKFYLDQIKIKKDNLNKNVFTAVKKTTTKMKLPPTSL